MNTQTQEALKMAIDYLELQGFSIERQATLEACKEAILRDVTDIDVGEIAQPAQEPVAFTNSDELSELQSGMTTCYMYKQAIDDDDIALYTHPCVLMHSAPVQEPVAWIEVTTHHEKYQTSKVILLDKGIKLPHDTLLYTHPAPLPAQEPVAWNEEEFNAIAYAYRTCPAHEIKMVSDRYQELVNYVLSITHPAPSCQECENLKHDLEGYMDANKALINREWQGLSDKDLKGRVGSWVDGALWAEKLLKEKNHASR